MSSDYVLILLELVYYIFDTNNLGALLKITKPEKVRNLT